MARLQWKQLIDFTNFYFGGRSWRELNWMNTVFPKKTLNHEIRDIRCFHNNRIILVRGSDLIVFDKWHQL